ncbi:MAG TPA: bL35 family ribosomal protein [Patescibacteria group bacterium]|nr:bL35 family ribosomal protein [Patescibacteria group bacterium]
MAKQKTRKSLKNRIKVTGTGKLLHRSTHIRHLRTHKSKAQRRRLSIQKETVGALRKKFRKMLPYDVR